MTRTTFTRMTAALAAMVLCPAALASDGRVVITEIMYNPNSKEDKGQAEWVEIANVGDAVVEIKDWRLDDEDKWDWGKFSCSLAPGGVAVLFNADYLTEDEFRAAWDGDAGHDYQAIGVKWGGIANSPGPDNEILQLLDSDDAVICEVRQVGGFPECNRPDGMSIYLVDVTASDLSDGKIWKRSDDGVAGGRINQKTEIFGGKDTGSPGYVPGLGSAGSVAASPGQPGKSSGKNSESKGAGGSSKPKPDAKPPTKAPAKSPDKKPAASQPAASQPDNKIDY